MSLENSNSNRQRPVRGKPKPWPDSHVSKLLTYWRMGTPASQIADLLPVNPNTGVAYSRSSILGKLHRMGETGNAQIRVSRKPRRRRQAGRKRRRESTIRRAVRRVDKALNQPAVFLPGKSNRPFIGPVVPLVELKAGQCKWPHGDPAKPSFGFCGNTCPRDRSYCDAHQLVSRRKVRRYNTGPFSAQEYRIIKNNWGNGNAIDDIAMLLNRRTSDINRVARTVLGLKVAPGAGNR